jgi:stringent starvation protein B
MSEQLNFTLHAPILHAQFMNGFVITNSHHIYSLMQPNHIPKFLTICEDGQIVLNPPHAIHQLHMSNDAITFSARFGGVAKDIYVPIQAVLGIYARENGQGLFFDPSEYDAVETNNVAETAPSTEEAEPSKKKPSLRILD